MGRAAFPAGWATAVLADGEGFLATVVPWAVGFAGAAFWDLVNERLGRIPLSWAAVIGLGALVLLFVVSQSEQR
ncbi:hypothetical protein [Kytococcus sp. HMSC28H12]|uniref:hypothetical protein n=1 Tax=Kytococcus sp. HMSC28H12 TaxID=1581067 RepID=UPI00114CC3BE|nr:hypothetical protein [Kytococcus sp. HMSC28H12]